MENNKVSNFGTVKNLREWLEGQFEQGKHLYYKDLVTKEAKKCYNVDLIWDGTNYHIAYTEKEDTTAEIFVQPFTYTDERVWSVK